MARSSLLLDADVIIYLHQLKLWNKVIKNYKIYVASSVIGEVLHYNDNGKRVLINLQKLVQTGSIQEISISLEELKKIIERIQSTKITLHTGELESIAIIEKNEIPNLMICLIDGAAIKILSFLSLDDKGISAEEVLKGVGIHKVKYKPLNFTFSKKRFQRFVTEGRFLSL